MFASGMGECENFSLKKRKKMKKRGENTAALECTLLSAIDM
jgi:predicted transglutaminase-like cysteine proteinase